MKIRVGLIYGGRSGEHEISVRSARTVIEQLDREKYDLVPIAVGSDGEWLSPADSLALFPEQTQVTFSQRFGAPSEARAVLCGDVSVGGLVFLDNGFGVNAGDGLPIDVIFPVLHGTYGEDGTIQGLFEM